MNKIGAISLGCSKNRVDTEELLGYLRGYGFEITPDASEAEIIIVNTCGFITPAKEESINTILDMARYKQEGECALIVVCGCLAQRYMQELKAELPEVDLFWGVKDQAGLAARIASLAGKTSGFVCAPKRLITTPSYSAYLRIADGCDNRCAYCAIPLIRGGRRSVPMEKLLIEARELAEDSVRELTVIAQDTSAYGIDLYGEPKLGELLTQLAEIEGIRWLRVLYTYPNTVDERLIDVIADNDKITNYIDMPIQHIDPDMLKRMNRHGSAQHIRDIMRYIRTIPGFIVRSTVIVGFPGETEEQFSRLAEYLEEQPFDRLGAFAYSQEEDTPAALMEGQIPEEVKLQRLDKIMRRQRKISGELNKKRIGNKETALIDGVTETELICRGYGEAPEVDGVIHVAAKPGRYSAGDFININVTDAGEYDLWGEMI